MEKASTIYKEVKQLDEKGLISLKMIQIWFVTLVIVFFSLLWIWAVAFPRSDSEIDYKGSGKVVPTMKFHKKSKTWWGINAIHIALIVEVEFQFDGGATEENIEETLGNCLLTMKSAVLFSTKIIHFHIFADETMYQEMLPRLDDWPIEVLHRVSFTFKSVYGPESPRTFDVLFLPLSFHYLDELLYVECGVFFTSSLDSMWEVFLSKKNTTTALISVGMRQTSFGSCTASNHISRDKLVYDSTVVIFNLKKLRRTKLKFPSAFENLPYQEALLADDDSYANFTWSSEMIGKFQSMLGSEVVTGDNNNLNWLTLNLVILYNPGLAVVRRNGSYLLPPGHVDSCGVYKWQSVANLISKVDFVELKSKDKFNSFFSYLLTCSL